MFVLSTFELVSNVARPRLSSHIGEDACSGRSTKQRGDRFSFWAARCSRDASRRYAWAISVC